MKYLSLDTEATGLTKECVLIELALVPVDTAARKVYPEHSFETLVHCPSFEDLKPTLNPWVIENNEGLIRRAHERGVSVDSLKKSLEAYLTSPELTRIFGNDRKVILGKSISALDLPLLHRTLSEEFMQKYFHHHTLDVTCVGRYLVEAGILPPGCESTSKVIRHFGIRDKAEHTALSDALDMANIYLKMLDLVKPLKA